MAQARSSAPKKMALSQVGLPDAGGSLRASLQTGFEGLRGECSARPGGQFCRTATVPPSRWGQDHRGSWQLWMGVHWRLRAGPLWSSPSREGSQLLCLRGTSVSGWQAGVASWKLAGAEGMGAPGRFGLHCPAPGPHPHAPGRSPRTGKTNTMIPQALWWQALPTSPTESSALCCLWM